MDIFSYILGKKAGGGLGTYLDATYIESTGSQYIDTGIKPNNTTKVEIEFQETNKYGNWPKVFGSEKDHDNLSFKADLTDNTYIHYIDTEYTISKLEVNQYEKHTFTLEEGFITYGSKELSFTETRQWSNNYNIYLFCCNRSNTPVENSAIKIFHCKIWNNGELVRDYIPKFRLTDYKFGLLDRVSGEFFINSGTGSFTGE